MQKLKHENILKLIEYYEEIKFMQEDGKEVNATVIIMEYACNGELFDYIAL